MTAACVLAALALSALAAYLLHRRSVALQGRVWCAMVAAYPKEEFAALELAETLGANHLSVTYALRSLERDEIVAHRVDDATPPEVLAARGGRPRYLYRITPEFWKKVLVVANVLETTGGVRP